MNLIYRILRVGRMVFIAPLLVLASSFPGCVTGGKIADPPKSAGQSFSDAHLDYKKWNRTNECCTAQGKKVAIASGGSQSSKCGEKVLEIGGNLVDAAVATAFCLAVERPHSVSIGGGGFMLLHLPRSKEKDIFLDFRETAPAASTKNMFLDSKGEAIPELNRSGVLSVATPGFVAGLYSAQNKYGQLKGIAGWGKVLAPAITLARDGFAVYPSLVEKIAIRKDVLAKDENMARLFLPNGASLKVGDKLSQSDLAKSLEKIAKGGPKVFYNGEIGKKVVQFIKGKNGVLTLSDLQQYKVKFRQPLEGTFRNYRVLTAPLPSAGGLLILQSLKTVEHMRVTADTPNGEYLHILAEVFKRSFADRYLNVADPDFEKVEPKVRLQESYISKISSQIKKESARPASSIKAGEGLHDESPDTTQLSLIDTDGNAISATITENYFFGSGLMVPETGIILNDEMGDFDPKGDQSMNLPLPGRRPISNMAPTIVLEGATPILSLGAAGGPYLITGIAQTILNRLLFGWSLRDSVFAPRIHHQWSPDTLRLETGGFNSSLISELKAKGHAIDAPTLYAQVQAAGFVKESGTVIAITDPRDEGGAAGK